MITEILKSSLIESLKAGDEAGFEEVYESYKHRIFKMAYRFSPDPFFADDVLQETMYRIYRGVGKLKGFSTISTWIYRIAYNACLDLLRKNKSSRYVNIEDARMISDEGKDHIESARLHRILDSLKKKERDILIFFYIDDLSIKELAEILKISESNAKVLLYRARKKAAEAADEMY